MKLLEKTKSKIHHYFNNIWYSPSRKHQKGLWDILSIFYRSTSNLLQCCAQKSQYQSKIPVMVIGNLTVGGNGKTPAIIALTKFLQSHHYKIGVISRGYPVNPKHPILLDAQSTAKEVGDEPLLIYRKTAAPVVVCRDRKQAIQYLEKQGVQIILSDDGLQNRHFRHNLEIILVDGARGFGNQKLLPAGPLREPLERLKSTPFIVEKCLSGEEHPPLAPYQLFLTPKFFLPLLAAEQEFAVDASYFTQQKILAITALANPNSFFMTLKKLGLAFESIALADHHCITQEDLKGYEDYQIIMTEKDAVKWQEKTLANNIWYLILNERFSENFLKDIKPLIEAVINSSAL